MFTVAEQKNNPLHLVAVIFLFTIAIIGYGLFSAWHNTAGADEILTTEHSHPYFKLNTNQHGLINTQHPVILNSSLHLTYK